MMDIIEAILRRPRTVLTVMVVLLLAGISAYINLPKESQPNIDVPYLYVSVSQTGVSPTDAETLLARPLETELRDLEGLVNISSTSTTGHASVFLEFDINFDKDKAMSDVRQRVDRAKPNLPSDANDPTVHEIDISGFPTISVAVYGDVPERTLIRYAEALQDELETIGTVREVVLSGSRKEVLEVEVDLLKLESYNLTTAELFDALARNNMVVPAGALDTGQGRFNIEVPGLIATAVDVYTLPLKSVGSTVVTFGDVASVKRTFKDATEFTRVNGAPALLLGVTKRTGTNIIDNSRSVYQIVERVTADWPEDIKTSYMLDQAVFAEDMLSSLENSVLTAVALVIIASIALLGIRPALLIGLSIPISFMVGFFFLQIMGITINMMIMFGLVLTVGLLVDSAIVVVEYAERKIAEGLPRSEAFIRAVRLMFVPIMSSTLTTIAAFTPLLLWPGIIGKFMSYLPIMVIVTLSASLITAMVFIPVVGAMIARRKIRDDERAQALALSGGAEFALDKVPGFTGGYVRTLAFLVRHPFMVIIAVSALMYGIIATYAANPTGVEAFPATEAEFATVAVTGRGNFSPTEVRDILLEVEEVLLPIEGIREIVMNFGTTGAVASVPADTIGNFQLEFVPYKDRRSSAQIFADIRSAVAHISGVGVEVVGAEEGPPAGKDINLRVNSTSYDDLSPTVARLRAYVENELGNVIDIEDGRPLPGIDWKVTIDRELAAQYGLGVRDLSPYVQLVTSGVTIGSYRPEDASDQLDIVVRLPEAERSFDALDSLRIVTHNGLVPVSNFIKREAAPKVANINRYNGFYSMTVMANVTGENPETGQPVMPSEKVAELRAWVDAQEWPSGIAFEYGGSEEQIEETNAFLVQAGLGAVFLMFLILLTQFNSFYQVFLTLLTIVLSLGGVFLGMIVTGQAFSAIMTGVGIVSLAAIVVNNAIILIDTYNRFRKDGIEAITATLMTAAQRLRPIMLTTITTVLGLLPMAIGISFNFFAPSVTLGDPSGMWWSQFSTAVVSGLMFSTILTLILIPVLLAAPTIWKRQIIAIWRWIGAGFAFLAGLFRRPAKAVTPDGVEIEVPEDKPEQKEAAIKPANDVQLVEKEKNGVVVISREAAE